MDVARSTERQEPSVELKAVIINGAVSGCTPSLLLNGVTITSPSNVIKSPPPPTNISITPEQRELMKFEREKMKLERERLRAEMKAQKDAERKAKAEEKERLKLERQEKKEKLEKEREEKRVLKVAEQKRKLEAQQEKEEAKKLREKERKERESQQKMVAADKQKKEQLVKEKFLGFFNQNNKSKSTLQEVKEEKPNTISAAQPVLMNDARLVSFETQINEQVVDSNYLHLCKHFANTRTSATHTKHPEDDDVIITEPKPMKLKFLQFHDNHRPAYHGTWQKHSSLINPRNPYRKDEVSINLYSTLESILKNIIDYEVESDMEWEEEEPGESLSDSEVEGDSGNEIDEDDSNDGFFVPHGYLSDGEGDLSDEESTSKNKKQDARAKAWEAEFSRKCQHLIPVQIGIVWAAPPGETQMLSPSKQLLEKFSAISLVTLPIQIGARPPDSIDADISNEALLDLVRLVHTSPNGINRLVDTFLNHWQAKYKDDHCLSLPKCKIKNTIISIATKETRPLNSRPLWYVHADILDRLGLTDEMVVPLSPMDGSTPPSGKRGVKRTGATPLMKPLQYFLKRSLKTNASRCLDLSSNPEAKKQKLEEGGTRTCTKIPDTCNLPNDAVVVIGNSSDTKENIAPIDQCGQLGATPSMNSLDEKDKSNNSIPNNIDWIKQLMEHQLINVHVDIHDT